MAYLTQTDLTNRLGGQTVTALYDDTGTSTVNATALADVLAGASARVDSYLARNYEVTLPITQVPIPAMVKEAALEWAIYLSFRRKPEYIRTYWNQALPDLQKSAEELSDRLAEAAQYIPDLAAQPTPGNVGGVTYDTGARLICDASDGTTNAGDF